MVNINSDEERIKDALIKRAIGYEYEEKEIIADKTGKPGRVRITKKHMPPDINAIKYIMSEDYNKTINHNKQDDKLYNLDM